VLGRRRRLGRAERDMGHACNLTFARAMVKKKVFASVLICMSRCIYIWYGPNIYCYRARIEIDMVDWVYTSPCS
jgi:hypothetical protein